MQIFQSQEFLKTDRNELAQLIIDSYLKSENINIPDFNPPKLSKVIEHD